MHRRSFVRSICYGPYDSSKQIPYWPNCCNSGFWEWRRASKHVRFHGSAGRPQSIDLWLSWYHQVYMAIHSKLPVPITDEDIARWSCSNWQICSGSRETSLWSFHHTSTGLWVKNVTQLSKLELTARRLLLLVSPVPASFVLSCSSNASD